MYPDKRLQYKLPSTLRINTIQLYDTIGTLHHEEQNRMTMAVNI